MRGCQASASPSGGAPPTPGGAWQTMHAALYTCGPDIAAATGVGVAHGSRGRCLELCRTEQQYAADRLDPLLDLRLDHGIVFQILALRLERDRPHEEEQANGNPHEDADDEHEAVEELLVVLARGCSAFGPAGL